jgi:deoxycytidine triphosphate deaminase
MRLEEEVGKMEKINYGSVLSADIIRSMVTEDIEWFKEQISKEEKILDKILISPFIPEGLEPASYDIHLGKVCFSHATGKVREIGPGDTLVIKPGETVSIESLEYIGLPQDIMALINSRTDFVIRGLSQISTHVDPGFHGRLFQTIANLSNRDIKLKFGDPIAHLTFFKVSGAKPNIRYKGRRLGQKSLTEEPIKKEIEKDPGSIIRPSYLKLLISASLAIITNTSALFAYILGKGVLGNLLLFPSILSFIALGLSYYTINKG